MKASTRLALEALKRLLQDPATKEKLKSGTLWGAVVLAALAALLTQLGVDVDLVGELASLIKMLFELDAPTQP